MHTHRGAFYFLHISSQFRVLHQPTRHPSSGPLGRDSSISPDTHEADCPNLQVTIGSIGKRVALLERRAQGQRWEDEQVETMERRSDKNQKRAKIPSILAALYHFYAPHLPDNHDSRQSRCDHLTISCIDIILNSVRLQMLPRGSQSIRRPKAAQRVNPPWIGGMPKAGGMIYASNAERTFQPQLQGTINHPIRQLR